MIPPIDVTQLPAPAQKILGDSAPPKLRQMAARGIIPGLRPDAIVCVLTVLAGQSGDLSSTARESLGKLPAALLEGALSASLPAAALLALAEAHLDNQEVIESLLKQAAVPIEAVEHVAQRGAEWATELVATNQERLIAHPRLIELLYMNDRTRMSTADRIVELAVRHDLEVGIAAFKEAAAAIKGQLIAEPSDEPLPEDDEFKALQVLADEVHDPSEEAVDFVETEEGEEVIEARLGPLYKQLGDMSISQRVRRAMLGSREERMILIRDPNKLVSRAAAKSPRMKESEVKKITASREVIGEVLLILGRTPKWTRSYEIKHNLVKNTKTPFSLAQRQVQHLREADLRRIAKSKNVSSAVRQAVKRHLSRRKK